MPAKSREDNKENLKGGESTTAATTPAAAALVSGDSEGNSLTTPTPKDVLVEAKESNDSETGS